MESKLLKILALVFLTVLLLIVAFEFLIGERTQGEFLLKVLLKNVTEKVISAIGE